MTKCSYCKDGYDHLCECPPVTRDCNNCAHHEQGVAPSRRCLDCLNYSTLIYFEPMSKAYDAAFRSEEATRRISVVSGVTPPMSSLVAKALAHEAAKKESSDGSTAGYYTLPQGAKELQDLISHKDMNAQMGEIFRAVYRFGEVSHSPKIRDIKKIIFYATEELKRLEKLEVNKSL